MRGIVYFFSPIFFFVTAVTYNKIKFEKSWETTCVTFKILTLTLSCPREKLILRSLANNFFLLEKNMQYVSVWCRIIEEYIFFALVVEINLEPFTTARLITCVASAR